MPWSNQGGGGPWGSGPKGPWGSGPQSSGPTPPDLEELLRRSQDKLRSVLPGGGLGARGVALLAIIAVVVWGVSGFFRVEPDEVGVVLRFGAINKGDNESTRVTPEGAPIPGRSSQNPELVKPVPIAGRFFE